MHPFPRPKSPKYTPRPLRPPPCPAPTKPVHSLSTEPENTTVSSTAVYPTLLKQPFDDPYEVLCQQFNVAKAIVPLQLDGSSPPLINMQVLRDAHMPTHVLVVLESHLLVTPPNSPISSAPPSPRPPLAVPINSELFARNFTNDIGQLSAELSVPGSTMPVPYWDESTRAQVVTLPTISLHAPHAPSIPLLLLYGLGLHLSADSPFHRGRAGYSRRRSGSPVSPARTSTGTLATYLLPAPVIGEFPAAAAMAEAMARHCTDLEMQRHAAFNQGLWRNVLALAPTDAAIVDLVRTAWNVTAEARRIRERRRTAAAAALARGA
ncbi:hypothetical protein AcW1_002616 [Taiwanofungus camphoratus]|nr:hypothetical protein AcV5_009703 [Antrodia cinnamomea]KAI0942841.1 hypothetical protein AcV7_002140 [Antrodia cinnamomea]KAI0943460.1 hypothetical protein AcW1_002616 [Antrodia cinnamomea]